MEEKQKLDVSVILPIESSKHRSFEELLERAVKSLQNQNVEINELNIVHTQEESLVNILKNYDFGELKVNLIENSGSKDFATQVNLGVKNSNSSWISILEFDDEYSSIWFKNVLKYSEVYPDVSIFLPIVVDVDQDTKFAGFTNEATFAANFTPEMGILTNETLMEYQNFQSSGMVVKKDTFIDFGLLKPSFKLTFGYEFFLRMTYNSIQIMSIPRIGYKHMNLREGSIFWNYKNGDNSMTSDEVKFWVESAKKEYFFINDRTIKYELKEV